MLLGEPFDIHGGGFDLIFPHHENEIAQSESLFPPPMVNVWMHGGLLLFDGRKMSKSLGNFEPLYALLDRHDPQAIRLLFLQIGYRKPLNFTESSIEGATVGLRRLLAAYDALRTAPPAAEADEIAEQAAVDPFRTRFYDALDDDMNTAGAVSVLFDLASVSNGLIARGTASGAAGFLHEAMSLLGISPSERKRVEQTVLIEAQLSLGGSLSTFRVRGPETVAAEKIERLKQLLGDDVPLNGQRGRDVVTAVIQARQAAKQSRNFALADKLRDALREVGIVLIDSKEGATWSVGG